MPRNVRSKKIKSKNIKNKNIKNKNTKKKMRGGNMSKKTEAIGDIRMKSGKKNKKNSLKKIIEIKELMDSLKEQMLLQMKTFEKINLVLGDYFTN